MITNLEIKNFKSHGHSVFPFSNLNILTGLNGMGKSSVVQMLLLLRQSYKQSRLSKGLQLNHPLCDIGLGKDALSQFAVEEIITCKLVNDGVDLEWQFSVEGRKAIESTFLELKEPIDPDINLNDISLFNDDFQYLSSERLAPQESYEKDTYLVETERQISNEKGRGELIAHFIHHYGKTEIAFEEIKHPSNEHGDLLSQTNAWLREISPNVNMNIHDRKDKYEIKYSYDVEGGFPTNEFRPDNVGFGISYALSVIVAILSARKNSLILIENPEAHIHPAGQASLARLMAIAANCGVQIIIETHSDHMINGALVAVNKHLKGENGLAHDKIKIFHFTRNSGSHATEVTPIPVLEDGRIKIQPDGFFDQIDKDLETLMGF